MLEANCHWRGLICAFYGRGCARSGNALYEALMQKYQQFRAAR
jgi:hypothetical protein